MTGKAILILGMHRSGTSALAGTLQRLGVRLSAKLLPSDMHNVTGYGESQEINLLMEKLLNAAGSRWHDWLPFSPAAAPPQQMLEITGALRATVLLEGGEADLFGIKDPRICRMVPLWIDLLRDIGREPLAVLVFRHPLAVARSLTIRDGMPFDKALLLWLRHVIDAERGTRSIPRVFVTYQGLLRDWRETARKVGSALQITWPIPPDAAAAEMEQFLSGDHNHHVLDEQAEIGGAPWFGEAWKLIQKRVAGQDDETEEFDRLAERVAVGCQPFQNYFSLIEKRVAQLEKQLYEATAVLDRARWVIGNIVIDQNFQPKEIVDMAMQESVERLKAVEARLDKLERP